MFNKENELLEYIKANNLKLTKYKYPTEENLISNLINLINNYLSGKKFNLYDKIKDLKVDINIKDEFSTEFAFKVITHLISIKYGEITSYSEIGTVIGSRAYRAIGNVLKRNPIPLIIPCHRVIRKNGNIGGFMGKLNNEWQQNFKKFLLKMESQN